MSSESTTVVWITLSVLFLDTHRCRVDDYDYYYDSNCDHSSHYFPFSNNNSNHYHHHHANHRSTTVLTVVILWLTASLQSTALSTWACLVFAGTILSEWFGQRIRPPRPHEYYHNNNNNIHPSPHSWQSWRQRKVTHADTTTSSSSSTAGQFPHRRRPCRRRCCSYPCTALFLHCLVQAALKSIAPAAWMALVLQTFFVVDSTANDTATNANTSSSTTTSATTSTGTAASHDPLPLLCFGIVGFILICYHGQQQQQQQQQLIICGKRRRHCCRWGNRNSTTATSTTSTCSTTSGSTVLDESQWFQWSTWQVLDWIRCHYHYPTMTTTTHKNNNVYTQEALQPPVVFVAARDENDGMDDILFFNHTADEDEKEVQLVMRTIAAERIRGNQLELLFPLVPSLEMLPGEHVSATATATNESAPCTAMVLPSLPLGVRHRLHQLVHERLVRRYPNPNYNPDYHQRSYSSYPSSYPWRHSSSSGCLQQHDQEYYYHNHHHFNHPQQRHSSGMENIGSTCSSSNASSPQQSSSPLDDKQDQQQLLYPLQLDAFHPLHPHTSTNDNFMINNNIIGNNNKGNKADASGSDKAAAEHFWKEQPPQHMLQSFPLLSSLLSSSFQGQPSTHSSSYNNNSAGDRVASPGGVTEATGIAANCSSILSSCTNNPQEEFSRLLKAGAAGAVPVPTPEGQVLLPDSDTKNNNNDNKINDSIDLSSMPPHIAEIFKTRPDLVQKALELNQLRYRLRQSQICSPEQQQQHDRTGSHLIDVPNVDCPYSSSAEPGVVGANSLYQHYHHHHHHEPASEHSTAKLAAACASTPMMVYSTNTIVPAIVPASKDAPESAATTTTTATPTKKNNDMKNVHVHNHRLEKDVNSEDDDHHDHDDEDQEDLYHEETELLLRNRSPSASSSSSSAKKHYKSIILE